MYTNRINNNITSAINTLNSGGIIIFPTDTAFGIGCRIDIPESVDRLFCIRKRPVTKATPVLVSSIDMALPYFDSPSDIVRHLMNTYWPGALTIVALCKQELIHSPIRGGGDTVGLRMPDHKDLLEVIAGVGVPILGPSANFFGEKTPYAAGELDPELVKRVDYVLPGECKTGNVSTVVDAVQRPPVVIRQGAVQLKEEDLRFQRSP